MPPNIGRVSHMRLGMSSHKRLAEPIKMQVMDNKKKTVFNTKAVVGENLTRLRLNKKLSGSQLAKAAGMSQRTVARMLTGKNFEIDSLDEIASYLVVQPFQLLVADMSWQNVEPARESGKLSNAQKLLLESYGAAPATVQRGINSILRTARNQRTRKNEK